ncbi:hypothetical protein [Streptomyces phaeochromogenes]|uniref:hypothetical protein n=1 Tax=Streptomyces phaeochromogenes TaxID=1923 RepID=UPI003863AF80|nr:hypothetical protein OHB08_00200 [Streptomyces phaeochromogenes]
MRRWARSPTAESEALGGGLKAFCRAVRDIRTAVHQSVGGSLCSLCCPPVSDLVALTRQLGELTLESPGLPVGHRQDPSS